jgi:hypothetical protein
MENSEIIIRLEQLKKEVSNLGHFYIKNSLPIAVDKFKEVAKPFSDLEQKFDESINLLNSKL